MKMIYLASPYSHKSRRVENKRFKEVTRVAAELISEYGHSFILPITQSYQLVKIKPELGGSFANWKKIDLHFVSKCDEVWVVTMDGWKESIGVQAEIEFAKKKGINIWFIDPKTFKKTKRA